VVATVEEKEEVEDVSVDAVAAEEVEDALVVARMS